MDLSNIPSAIREKAEGLNAMEILELAKNEGVELTDDQLDAVAGGDNWDGTTYTHANCRDCGTQVTIPKELDGHTCPNCGRWVTRQG